MLVWHGLLFDLVCVMSEPDFLLCSLVIGECDAYSQLLGKMGIVSDGMVKVGALGCTEVITNPVKERDSVSFNCVIAPRPLV